MALDSRPTRPCAARVPETSPATDGPETLALCAGKLRLLYEVEEAHMPEIVHALATLTTPQRRAVRDLIEAFAPAAPRPCGRA